MAYFTHATLAFLRQLERHNSHEWFREHKDAYEKHVREPALHLIADLAAPLTAISPHLRAEPRKVGGSLFRVMRDTRRKHPEGPYKAWIGLRFFHEQRREVHAPSFYLHLSPHPENSFVGGGLWKPEAPTLKKIRAFMEDNPNTWKQAISSKSLARYNDEGPWLTHMPRGFSPDHPLAQDLRRTSFIWDRPVSQEIFLSPKLKSDAMRAFKDVSPVVDYLCASLDLPF